MPTTAIGSAQQEQLFGHPKGLFVCFFTEMWERFSFYGMKALLFLYLTKYHLFGDGKAYDLLGAYGGLVYAVPVLGGLLADRYLGMRKAVVLGAVLLCLGHFGMAFEGKSGLALQVFYLSLALIVVGVGFLKPNISTIVGKLYPENDPRRDSGFTLFYAGINLGAFFSSLICGYLGETYGWRYGFGAAGVGMVAGLLVFLWGQKYLQGHAEPARPERLTEKFLGPLNRERAIYLGAVLGALVVWQLIQRTWTVHSAMHLVAVGFLAWFIYFLVKHCTRAEREQMGVLLLIIFANLIFFAMYEQTYGSWVAFTDRLLTKNLLGLTFTAGSLTFLGALFIVLLSPVFAWLWPFLDKRGLNPSTMAKCAIGLVFGGLAFVPLILAADGIQNGPAHVMWLVAAYFVLELGEMCLSPIGLSAVTQLSVPRVVSLMMGAWFLATAYSEVLAAGIGKLTALELPEGGVFNFTQAASTYSTVFTQLLVLGLAAGALYFVLNLFTRKWMHGVK